MGGLRLGVKQKLHSDGDHEESPEEFEGGAVLRRGLSKERCLVHPFARKPGQATRQGQRAHNVMVHLNVVTGRMWAMHMHE